MNIARSIAITTLLGSLPLLAACGPQQPPTSSKPGASQPESSVISGAIEEAISEAKREIAEGNISISDEGKHNAKAEITPKGDLLIDGRAVAVDPAQRALLLEYRTHVASVAEAGMEIGMQGADLATKAMGEALKGVFTGNADQVEQRVEAEAEKIKVSALKLCDRLPAMLETQAKLAAALPEFAPYATMTQQDVDDCGEEAHSGTKASKDATSAPSAG